jgi:glycosyltransferase involved in cell wall biosynthesis
LLAPASSIHVLRWANGLSAAGHEVHVVSKHLSAGSFAPDIQVHLFPLRGKVGYFTMAAGVRKLLKKLQPDIVNAHYASGYGTTAMLVNYRPWVLSVWGSDVYDFPYKSLLHKWLLRKNLVAADAVVSTSRCMAEQTRLIAPSLSGIAITPFGVDMKALQPIDHHTEGQVSSKGQLVVGTVKHMENKYGIDTLLEAFALVRKRLQCEDNPMAGRLVLRLVGGGSQIEELKLLTQRLSVADAVVFTGRVPHHQVVRELAKLDIYVALSRLESFGVATIEASAARCPVVVSDAGGLPEVTIHGQTGFVVPRENPDAAAEAMLRLIRDPGLRFRMGAAGHRHVQKNYNWPTCIETMIGVYQTTIERHPKD